MSLFNPKNALFSFIKIFSEPEEGIFETHLQAVPRPVQEALLVEEQIEGDRRKFTVSLSKELHRERNSSKN